MSITNLRYLQEDIAELVREPLPWQVFHQKTILVTGAAGMLPAYFVDLFDSLEELLQIRCRILAIVRSKTRAIARLQRRMESRNVSVIEHDVALPFTTRERIDYIIHGASPASPVHYMSKPLDTISANVLGTRHLVDLAEKSKSSGLLFLSSAEIYGDPLWNSAGLVAESGYGVVDPCNPRACYSESKRLGESLCVAARNQLLLNTQIVRPFHTYGPGLRFDDGRIFADLVRDLVEGNPFQMKSDGTPVRSFCYARDAVAGILHVLLSGDGQPYNIGNPDASISVRDLIDLLSRTFRKEGGAVESLARIVHDGAVSRICPDISRAKSLGWRPRTDIVDGFRRTVESYL